MQRNSYFKKTHRIFLGSIASIAFLVGCDPVPAPSNSQEVKNFRYTAEDEDFYRLYACRILRFHTEDLIKTVEENMNQPLSKQKNIQESIRSWLESYPMEEGTVPLPTDRVKHRVFIDRFSKDFGLSSQSKEITENKLYFQRWTKAIRQAQELVYRNTDNIYFDPYLPIYSFETPRIVSKKKVSPELLSKQKTR